MQFNYNSFIQIINFYGLFRNALSCRKTGALMVLTVLPGTCVWSLDTYFNLSPIYHLYVLFVEISYQARFVFKNHTLQFIYIAHRIYKSWEFYHSRLSTETSKVFTVSVFLLGAHVHVLLPGTWWLLYLQSIHVPSQYMFPQRFWLAILCSSPFLSKTSAFVHLEHFFLCSSIASIFRMDRGHDVQFFEMLGTCFISILTKSVFTREQKCAIRMIVQVTVILMMVFWPVCMQISITRKGNLNCAIQIMVPRCFPVTHLSHHTAKSLCECLDL